MNYFFAYHYTLGTGKTGVGSCVLMIDRPPANQIDIDFLTKKIREQEFEKESILAIVITNFIKL